MTEPRAEHQTIPTTTSTELAEKVRQQLMAIEAVGGGSPAKTKLTEFESVLDEVREYALANHADGEYMTEEHIADMLLDARIELNYAASKTDDPEHVARNLVLLKDILLKIIFGERHDTLTSRKDFLAAEKKAAK